MTIVNSTPSAIECRFATYVKSKDRDDVDVDAHIIKEQIHNADGTITPNLKIIENYERKFYVTVKGKRNHKQKREWTKKENVIEFSSTQSKLQAACARALGTAWFKGSMRDLQESPYLYGTDISSTAILKQKYADKWPIVTPFTNAVFDTETDVVNGTNKIIMATISFKGRIFTAVDADFLKGHADAINKIQHLADKYIGDVLVKRNAKIEVVIVPTEIDIVKATIAKAHEWMPDFLSVWNVAFDINKIIEACDRSGTNIAEIMSDPSVPDKYKHFKFKEGPAKKVTASGVVMSYKPAARWHSVTAPSSFYWIDAMCAYKAVRTGSPEEKSYSLDAILNKELNIGKLKFEEANGYEGLAWHVKMQTDHKLEYVVYNIFDCVSMEMLDEKTLDLQLTLPMNAGSSDFANFNSQPKRLADSMHHFCLKHDHVIGCTSGEMKEDEDNETTSLSGWVVMLPAHLIADNGLKIIEENPWLPTNLYSHVGDLDVEGSYPNGGASLNISKETTKRELLKIEGLDEREIRMGGINLSGGHTNAVEIACSLYKLPTFDVLLSRFINEGTSVL